MFCTHAQRKGVNRAGNCQNYSGDDEANEINRNDCGDHLGSRINA